MFKRDFIITIIENTSFRPYLKKNTSTLKMIQKLASILVGFNVNNN